METRSAQNLGPAGWIRGRLHRFGRDVGSVIPAGFDAYARVFHPAYNDIENRPVTWREIAERSGRVVHAQMQFGNIAGSWSPRSLTPDVWTSPPRAGTLTRYVARALVSVLRDHTTTPEPCWFAIWEGYGLPTPTVLPKIELPNRRYSIASGPIDDVVRGAITFSDIYQSPNLWWPDAISWCVSTEVDLAYTYVGGTVACIDEVLANPRIEALPAQLTDGIAYDSDTINPAVPMRA